MSAHHRIALLVVSAVGLVGCGAKVTPSADSGSESAAPKAAPVVYRLDYSLVEEAPGAPPITRAYSLAIGEKHTGKLRAGANAVLDAGHRADVGLAIAASYTVANGKLALQDNIDISFPGAAGAIARVKADQTTAVTPGVETQVATLGEPTMQHTFRLMVTATPIAIPTNAAPTPPEFRLNYALTTSRDGEQPQRSKFTTNVVEHHPGLVQAGQVVPLQVMPAGSNQPFTPMQDVGFRIACSYDVVGGALVVREAIEYSGMPDAPAITKVTVDTTTVVTPGEETQVFVLEEPLAHRKMRLVLTAAKLPLFRAVGVANEGRARTPRKSQSW